MKWAFQQYTIWPHTNLKWAIFLKNTNHIVTTTTRKCTNNLFIYCEKQLHHLTKKQGHEISGCADVRTNVKGITKSYTMGTPYLCF